jgi:hypothetical protein
VYLNAASFDGYERLRTLGDLTQATKASLEPFVSGDDGIGRLFDRVVASLAAGRAGRLRDVATTWREQPGNEPPV